MNDKSPHIRYNTPWARTTQSMNTRKIENAVKKLSTFLEKFTDTDIYSPESVSFSIQKPFYGHEDITPLLKIKDDLLKNFNPISKNLPTGSLFGTEQKIEMSLGEYDFETRDTEKLIEFMIANQPFQKYSIETPSLVLSYTFKLFNPDNQSVVGKGRFLVWIKQNSKINANLWFDYRTPNEKFWKYIGQIQKQVPFKFDHANLRHATPKRDGSDFKLNKL